MYYNNNYSENIYCILGSIDRYCEERYNMKSNRIGWWKFVKRHDSAGEHMEWSFIKALESYRPETMQEEADRATILQTAKFFQKELLLRENSSAHITSSAFIVNPERSKILLVHHNLRQTWSWPGGHADGEEDLIQVAMREAKEETGVQNIMPLSGEIASLDIFPVQRHVKNGKQVSPHLHFSVSYYFVCDEQQPLRVCPSENTAVRWFPLEFLGEECFHGEDAMVYQKCIKKLKRI